MRAKPPPDPGKSSAASLVEDASLTGHEYDGILEYDNPLPAWWKNLFWATVLFSIGYYAYFQILGEGETVSQSYAEEMRLFREQLAAEAMGQEVTEEGLAKLMADPAMVSDGKSVFVTRCQQCHADQGQGNIGPNLTDDHWLHGSGSLMAIYELVSKGQTLKGMPAWSRTLRPMELGQVVAFVGSIRGSNIPGRPPQGTRVDPSAAAPAAAGGAGQAIAPSPPVKASSNTAPAKVDTRSVK